MKYIAGNKSNIWLKSLIIIIFIIVGVFIVKRGVNMIGNYSISEIPETDRDYFEVKICDNKAYLMNSDNESVFGPYNYIYDEYDSFGSANVFRYIDNNGLIGYAKIVDGGVEIIYSGIFSEASEMREGVACVKKGEEFHYIDTQGKCLMYDRYKDAFPFEESRWGYARVQKMNGEWCIIDRKGNQALNGFDSINELPYYTCYGSGMKDEKIVLFSLDQVGDRESIIVKELEGYSEINEQSEHIIVVTSCEGYKGVICIWNGVVIVPANYTDIEWEYCNEDDISDGEPDYWFRCKKKDGTYDVIYWSFS